jgi:serine/threonine protein phosphatase PrpC
MPEWVVESSHLSDTGRKRRQNEDYVASYEPTQLSELEAVGRVYVLADGVGGSAAGEIASQYAVKRVISSYVQERGSSLATRLVRAIETANAEIFVQNSRRHDQREMATTVVAAVIRGDELTVANVGDSRAYLIAGETIRQITQDHSLVAEMIREGAITSAQAETHPYRNVILRSVGSQSVVKVDVFSQRVIPSDHVVLCSDGLTRCVTAQEMARMVADCTPAQAARRLVDLANERGGDDNITVSIVHVTGSAFSGDGDGPSQPPQAPRWEDL